MFPINEMRSIVDHFDNPVHKTHGKKLIEEIERLQKIIDDGIPAANGKQFVAVDIPEGYELACREMRCPKAGEYYLNHNLQVLTATHSIHPAIIVKKKWVWPEWLTAPWIAHTCDSDTSWYAFNYKPKPIEYGWCIQDDKCYKLPLSILKLGEMPKFERWQDSLMQNPHIKHN